MTENTDEDRLSRREAEDLARLVPARVRVLKTAARERAERAKADFESEIAAKYEYDQDEVWRAAAERAREVINEVKKEIAARCAELGIPEEFAPSLQIGWRHTGYGNSLKDQKAEMRRVAHSRIDAMLAKTLTDIEREGLELKTQLLLRQNPSPAQLRTLAGLGGAVSEWAGGLSRPERHRGPLDRRRQRPEGDRRRR